MNLALNTELLRHIELFSQFSNEQLRLLAFSSDDVYHRDGEIIFEKGDKAYGAYVVASGNVAVETDIRSEHLDQRQSDVQIFHEGSLIGGLSLLVDGRHDKRARAVGVVELIHVRRLQFIRILREFPGAARRLFLQHSRQFSLTTEKLSAVAARLQRIDSAIVD